jgi:hypothetical protein
MSTLLQWGMQIGNSFWLLPTILLFFTACNKHDDKQSGEIESSPVSIIRTGWIKSENIKEASGMQASYSRAGDFFVHNDDGGPLIYVTDETGQELGSVAIVPAKNKDWEDITSVPVDDGRWLVVGDIGDNGSRRKSIRLYFIEEPQTGKNERYSGQQELKHWLSLTYPDGPRDCESMAYDPIGKQILLLSKRDKPPRLYAIDLETALSQGEAELIFLGDTAQLRPPTPSNRAQFGGRTDWISQPTGFDISPDGNEAVVITYRSLYHYRRQQGEDWLTAMQRKPDEVVGPPAVQNEAITYSIDGKAMFVTTEKQPAPIHKVEFTTAD